MSTLTIVEDSQSREGDSSFGLYVDGELKVQSWGMTPREVAREVIKHDIDKLESFKLNLGGILSLPKLLPKNSTSELSASVKIQVVGQSFKEISKLKDWVNKFAQDISLNFSVNVFDTDDGFRISNADWLTKALLEEQVSFNQIDVELKIKEVD